MFHNRKTGKENLGYLHNQVYSNAKSKTKNPNNQKQNKTKQTNKQKTYHQIYK